MRRIVRPRVFILVILSAAVAAVIATIVSQKQRLQVMDEAERRQYLGGFLEGRISDEQIDRIAEAVSTALDKAESAPESADQAESGEAAEEAEEAESEPEGASDEESPTDT